MGPDDLLADHVKLGSPAHRALTNADILSFADLAKWTQRDIARLHGIGPSALPILTAALLARGLAFKP